MRYILEGFADLFNLSGNCYRRKVDKVLNKSINQALREDAEKIGQDFRNAFNKLSLHRTVEQR